MPVFVETLSQFTHYSIPLLHTFSFQQMFVMFYITFPSTQITQSFKKKSTPFLPSIQNFFTKAPARILFHTHKNSNPEKVAVLFMRLCLSQHTLN